MFLPGTGVVAHWVRRLPSVWESVPPNKTPRAGNARTIEAETGRSRVPCVYSETLPYRKKEWELLSPVASWGDSGWEPRGTTDLEKRPLGS